MPTFEDLTMPATSPKIFRMDVQKTIAERLKYLERSQYALAEALHKKHKLPQRTIYRFLCGETKSINAKALGLILDEVGLKIAPK
jgi:hypothetical protein